MDRTHEIAQIAYSLFEHRGHAHGRDGVDWFLAERIFDTIRGRQVAPTRRPLGSGPKPSQGGPAAPQRDQEARTILREASDERGRAAVAADLGYRSTSAVDSGLRPPFAHPRTPISAGRGRTIPPRC